MSIRSALLVSSLFLAASSLPNTISVVNASPDLTTAGQLTRQLHRLQHLLHDLKLIQAAKERESEEKNDFGSDNFYGAGEATPYDVTPEVSRDWKDNELSELHSPDEEKFLVEAAIATIGLAGYGAIHAGRSIFHALADRD